MRTHCKVLRENDNQFTLDIVVATEKEGERAGMLVELTREELNFLALEVEKALEDQSPKFPRVIP